MMMCKTYPMMKYENGKESETKVLKLLLTILFCASLAAAHAQSFVERLTALPGVAVKTIRPDSGFTQAFEIYFTQPVDHNKPKGRQFRQRIILSHKDTSRPVVLITEGYQFYSNPVRELSLLLDANEIRVEHRYFGQSKPDSLDWSCLTIEQAAADHHCIVQAFKQLYPGKWVNSGWSKGGQTAIFHRRFYPDDVTVTVAYDAPLNLEREETRIDRFFQNVGSAACRKRLKDFQRLALQRKSDLLPLMDEYARQKGYTYSIGLNTALEYIVLEYPFSFWQYHKIDCLTIPDSASTAAEIFNHLKKVVSLSSYSDRALDSPAMYQFFTQLGYYGYVRSGLEQWLSGAYGYSNAIFAPRKADVAYNPQPMRDINGWLQSHADRMLFIYGENDPWSAPAVRLSGKTDALVMWLKGGNHYTFIQTFPRQQRQEIYDVLKRWLGIDIEDK